MLGKRGLEVFYCSMNFFSSAHDQVRQKPESTPSANTHSTSSLVASPRVTLPYDKGLLFLHPHDIIFCTSKGNYTSIYTTRLKPVLVQMTLSKLEDLLQELCMRVHNQYLVNMACIERYHKGDGGEIVLCNGVRVPVARNRKKEFLERVAFDTKARSH